MNLLVSSGIITAEDVRRSPQISMYASETTEYLKLFVSELTEADIPKNVQRYFSDLFRNKILLKRKQENEVTINAVKCRLIKLKDKENDLHEIDEAFVKNIIRSTLNGADGENSFKTQFFKAIGLDTDKICEHVQHSPKNREVVRKPSVSSTEGTVRCLRNSNDSDKLEEDTLPNGIPNSNDCFIVPSQSIGSILPHPNIKNEINCVMDILDPSDSDADVEDSSINNTFSDILENVSPILSTSSSPNKGTNYEHTNNVNEKSSTKEAPEDRIVIDMDTSIDDIPKVTPTLSVLPVINNNSKMSDDVVKEKHGVLGVYDPFTSIHNNVGAVDIQKYMNGLAEFLCQRMPKERRRRFLSKVDGIVSAVLEE